MSKFEMLCSLLPAEINWGDPITPQMVEEIVATEREACAITGGAAADAGLDGREVANAIRMRSNFEVSGLAARALDVCKQRGWSLRWDARLAQMTCESAEFAEAVRGKRGEPVEEAGDMLFVLMSWTESAGIPFADVVAAAERKCLRLEIVPRYAGEQFETPND